MTTPSPSSAARVTALRAGAQGVHIETGTTAVTGNFVAIEVIEAATFTTLTLPDNGGDVGTGFAWPVGSVIPGPCTAFTMSSGKVVAYKGTV